jgi:hypothetical protein
MDKGYLDSFFLDKMLSKNTHCPSFNEQTMLGKMQYGWIPFFNIVIKNWLLLIFLDPNGILKI